jgi:uncharacterized protein HemY
MTNKFSSFFPGATIIILLTIIFSACKTKTENKEENTDSRSLAVSYLRQNKFDEAEAAFKKAIKLNPDYILNYINLSFLYLNEGHYDDAEKQVNTGLKYQPQNTDLKLILAEIYFQKGNKEKAKEELQDIIKLDPKNVAAYYKLATLAAGNSNYADVKFNLLKILDITPANIAVRLQLAELLANERNADSSLFYIQSIKKIMPEFSLVTDTVYKKITALLHSNQMPEALYYIKRFRSLVEVTKDYVNSVQEINQQSSLAGYSEFTDSRFSEGDFQINKDVSLNNIKFTDASAALGLTLPDKLNATHSVLALADDDGTGSMYIYASFSVPGSSSSQHYLFARDMGSFRNVSSSAGINHEAEEFDAAFADYDNDGYQDLFISTNKGIIVYKNQGDGTFSRVKKNIGLNNINDGNKMLIADFDQDGDLDLYVACKGANKFFRNNNDGTFTEEAKMLNLASDPSGTKSMDFGDWDFDGDLDIATLLTNGSIQFFNNDRHSKFENITDSLKLQNPQYNGSAIAFGDYNNDGLSDLFIGGGNGENSVLLKNNGDKGFTVDAASKMFSTALKDITVNDVAFIDFDNDGHEDILVAGTSAKGKGVQLFHNDTTKGFSNVSNLLPSTLTQAQHISIADFNLDGDDDIYLTAPTGIYLIRNDGGSLNHNMQVQLYGLAYGNSKNNRLGIGAQVELKAGDLYQLKTIRRSLTNFGVGMRDSLDAVRIIWPNGTPQYINNPSRRQELVEEEKLKGSCPFLFAWNGKKYEFVKDMLWRSALGMPLAINGKDTTYAFSEPSKEYLLIPGENLQPKNNKYSIKITEELWEAVYFDKAELIAVDHPDSVNVFADERFVAPPYPGEKIYSVSNKNYPVTATDGNGDNVLDKIKAYDFQYISNFNLGKFQGLAEDHDLILDLGNKAESDSVYLFLRGWTFPTDASINTSMAQSDKYKQQPPSLQVTDKNGNWKTVIPNIGFPMGKDKMVIVNLSGKFLTSHNRRIRIQTNMQVYWDEIFFSDGLSKAPVEMHNLTMTNASLAYRGYSATYRKGGPFGPHWFDYYNVSNGQKWRDLTGYYTRYGNVLPLLTKADDEYIIADGGDEISIDFDASNLPALPKGWKRDFLIYSEGWVKDGDLNTAYGQTVAPLPFHNMPSYPYTSKTTYPFEQHKTYMQQYNTRKVSTDNFINALKQQTEKNKAAK